MYQAVYLILTQYTDIVLIDIDTYLGSFTTECIFARWFCSTLPLALLHGSVVFLMLIDKNIVAVIMQN